MLSIDTPEVHYPGNAKPSRQDENFKKLSEWINQRKAPVAKELGQYLLLKLETGNAGTLHEDQGNKVTKEFEDIISKKLTKPNGKKRTVFIKAANESFDQYGRLLAYVAPSYKKRITIYSFCR